MIYLVFQIIFIFLTQIYYKMNMITSSQTMISIKDSTSFLEKFSASGWLYFVAHKNTCFWKYLQNFLTFEKFLQTVTFLKMLLFHKFFSNFFTYFKNTYFSKTPANGSFCKCNYCYMNMKTLMVNLKKKLFEILHKFSNISWKNSC